MKNQIKFNAKRSFSLLPEFDQSLTFLNSGLTQDGIRTARGILICLVVLGHIDSFSPEYKAFTATIYNFHVISFLMISMLKTTNKFSFKEFYIICKRYLGLLIPITIIAFLIFQFLIEKNNLSNISSVFSNYFMALITGNVKYFDLSTGLELFWFMYAITGLVTIRMLIKKYAYNNLLRIFSLIIFSFIGGLSTKYLQYSSPSWIGIASYSISLIVLSFFIINIFNLLEKKSKIIVRITLIIIFLILSFNGLPGGYNNLAHLKVPLPWDIINYFSLIFYVSTVFKIISFTSESSLCKIFFRDIGSYSLGIYLTHMFFLYPLNTSPFLVNLFEPFRIIIIFISVMFLSTTSSQLLLRK
ncbi:acyltransferase family protein [Prochlorococcus marinus]|uniref:acyltransferase family protein n=1 Tax=Prochlorococcus marinus TaxID=1219 RepID=UPI0022B5CA74|nr:acyltransferase family protein [Prochlorococcus marinus]